MTMTMIDLNAWWHASLLRIVPETDAGERWCSEHINAEPALGAYNAEHRYGPDILLAAHNSGLTVALDGKIADAPRMFQPCGFCPDGRVCATLRGCFIEQQAEGDG
jgi:hypothetical protein